MINDESNHKEPDCDTKPSEGEIDEASERSASSDDYKETTSHPGWKGFHKNPEHVFGACITVFTLFLTASTVYQACAMRDQSVALVKSNNINHEALVTVQRAFVFPKPTLAPFKYDEGRKVGLGFFVTWENSGSTPTRDLTININSGSFDQT